MDTSEQTLVDQLNHLIDENTADYEQEQKLLEGLLVTLQQPKRRQGSQEGLSAGYDALFTQLVDRRFADDVWREECTDGHMLSILQMLRLLMREGKYLKLFLDLDAMKATKIILTDNFDRYHRDNSTPFVLEILVELTSILKKITSGPSGVLMTTDAGIHQILIFLLDSSDGLLLHLVLLVLINLALAAENAIELGRKECIHPLLGIVASPNIATEFRTLAADLLNILIKVEENRQRLRGGDGLATCLSLLSLDDVGLLETVVSVLCTLCLRAADAPSMPSTEDPQILRDIHAAGGIPILLQLVSPPRIHAYPQRELSLIPLLRVTAQVLTYLSTDDENARQIRVANGVYYLGVILTSDNWKRNPDSEKDCYQLQAAVFQTLRFLFSVERNRKVFKRLFPGTLYASFIDVGHYQRQMEPYFGLVQRLSALTPNEMQQMRKNVEDINNSRPPQRRINEYEVLETLGMGAFGAVYMARKENSETYYAMKELPAAGDSDADVDEVEIMTRLRHPNIIRYYQSFLDAGHLYIVMELVDSASLLEHIDSVREKKKDMSEEKIWQIFIQLCLALKYCHKTKNIVHRDLKPSNIMIDAEGVLKLADFGLARQISDVTMRSAKGTPGYFCPEVFKGEAYDEKADTWALGCILYQMAALRPPFASENILALGQKIVNGEYDPAPLEKYSPLLRQIVRQLIEPNPSRRLDIVQVSQLMAPLLLDELSRQNQASQKLRRELVIEKRRVKTLLEELAQTQENYRRLFAAAQKRAAAEGRPSSAKGLVLRVSPAKVRSIQDPISQMLNQLHKIIYITQLPPAAVRNPRRAIVDKYKKALFSTMQYNLKDELQKIVTGAKTEIDLDFGIEWSQRAAPRIHGDEDIPEELPEFKLTYEELQETIEDVLNETGYYQLAPRKQAY